MTGISLGDTFALGEKVILHGGEEIVPVSDFSSFFGELSNGDLLASFSGELDGYMFFAGGIFLIRILLICWTLKDAISRSDSVFYQLFSALLVLFLTPVVGLPIYLVFRPVGYKWEKGIWREALSLKLLFCPHCKNGNSAKNNVCVYCWETLKISCKECHKKYSLDFAYCPDCGAPNIE